MKYKPVKGFTIMVCFGKWGKPEVKAYKMFRKIRICLGWFVLWVALSDCEAEYARVRNRLLKMVDESDKNKTNIKQIIENSIVERNKELCALAKEYEQIRESGDDDSLMYCELSQKSAVVDSLCWVKSLLEEK